MRPVAVGGAVLVLTAGIFFSSTFHSPAQFKLQADVAPIEPEQEQPVSDKPDTVVRIVAESKGLPEIQQSELPRYGTYWEALSTFGQIMAPMPWLPTDARVIYQMADGQFLVDNGQTCQIPQPIKHGKLQAPTPAEFLQSQVDKLVGLIAQVQSAPKQTALDTKSPGALKRAGVMSRTSLRMASASASSVPTPGGGGSGTPEPPPSPDTRRNYAKFQNQVFAVVDTNKAAVNDTNLFNVCASFPDDTGTGPSLQIAPFGTDAVIIKANHFDYSAETDRDFALLVCDKVETPVWKSIDFAGASDVQDGWLVQGTVPKWKVTDSMYFLISNIAPSVNAFFRAIPYSGAEDPLPQG